MGLDFPEAPEAQCFLEVPPHQEIGVTGRREVYRTSDGKRLEPQRERNLIEGSSGGRRGALERILSRYRRPIEASIRSQLGPRLRAAVEADDLVQETFLRALQSMEQFRGGTAESF